MEEEFGSEAPSCRPKNDPVAPHLAALLDIFRAIAQGETRAKDRLLTVPGLPPDLHTVADDLLRNQQDDRAAVERLLDRERIRDRFLAMIGHDLAGLTGALRLQLQMLQRSSRQATPTKDLLGTMTRTVTRFERLIVDLRTSQTKDDDHFPLHLRPIDLTGEIHHAITDLPSLGDRPKIRAAVPDGVAVEADPIMIQQVLHNLLTNAREATHPGGTITVETEESGEEVLVTVADEGMGIPHSHLDKVFQPGVRLAWTGAGRGLGLHICRRIVEGHGGRIWCESPGVGKGSRFSFTLPKGTAIGGEVSQASERIGVKAP